MGNHLVGCDFSQWNPIDDYDKVASALDFVILKIIKMNGKPDPLFETHWENFSKRDIYIQGVYNYSYAGKNVQKYRTDAETVVKVLNGRKVMVWLDIEDDCEKNLGETLIKGIKEYAKVINDAGLCFGIYTGLSFYNSYLRKYAAELMNYPIWMARYPSKRKMTLEMEPNYKKLPEIAPSLWGWQYTKYGRIDGVKGDVDISHWYGAFVTSPRYNNVEEPVVEKEPEPAPGVVEPESAPAEVIEAVSMKDTWMSYVKAVKSEFANAGVFYNQSRKIDITVNDVTKKVRCDCSGAILGMLQFMGVVPDSVNMNSASFAAGTNKYLETAGFVSSIWPGWNNLVEGDIIAKNGHVEIFSHNDGAKHYVYNTGSTKALCTAGVSTSTVSGYTRIWRAPSSAIVKSVIINPGQKYIPDGFREGMALKLGLNITASPSMILTKTRTISTTINKNAPEVTCLEYFLKELGLYNGVIEAECGKTPSFGTGMKEATIKFQKQIGLSGDGEWTENNVSYKTALNMKN